MLFNSIDFGFYIIIVFCLYWFVFNKNTKIQNTFLLIASYIFYGWWDYRFLSLILFSSCLDFIIGNRLEKEEKESKRKILLTASLVVNLGLLGFFKYYNFFLDNLETAFTFFGTSIDPDRLTIILPVGISFYTFQTLSYSIDIYRKEISASKELISFLAFVSFFPQLVAGPIERAKNLLPQFSRSRDFDLRSAKDGMRQILWGMFKKVVIADNCAYYVNIIFDSPESYPASVLAIGAILFAFQIYGDFSGYSDIAIGVSRLFGFNLMRNFHFPYFSRDIAEFWRRWHISLSTWFRDYLYFPLGGSRGSKIQNVRNVFIIFLVSGFWHGANWTFIIWGGINAILFLPLLLTNYNRSNIDAISTQSLFPSFKEFIQIMLTFTLTTFAWIFFRAESVSKAVFYINELCSWDLISIPNLIPIGLYLLILILLVLEWLHREKEHGLEFNPNIGIIPRWTAYLTLSVLILAFFGKGNSFIYFQF